MFVFRNPQSISSLSYSFLIIFVFCVSYFVLPYHTGGDQVHYSRAYYSVFGHSFFDALSVYRSIIYSQDIIHFIIIKFGSDLGIPRILLMSIFNAYLAFLMAFYLRRKGFSFLLVLLAVLSNYYLFAVFFTLERMKFGLLFFLLYLVYNNRFFIFISLLAHFSFIIPVFIFLFSRYVIFFLDFLSRFLRGFWSVKVKNISALVFVCIFIFLFLFTFWGALYDKLYAYSLMGYLFSPADFIKIIILAALAFFSCKPSDRMLVLLSFFMLSCLIVPLNGVRIFFFGLFIFYYFVSVKSRFSKFSIVLISLYLLFKTFVYFYIIFNFGG